MKKRGLRTKSSRAPQVHRQPQRRETVQGMGAVGRPASTMRGTRWTTPYRAYPLQVLDLSSSKGPLRSLYVRGVLLAAPPWRRALLLAGRSNLSLHHACRNPQMAAAKEAEVVAMVTIRDWWRLGEPQDANVQLLSKRSLESTHPLDSLSSSPR